MKSFVVSMVLLNVLIAICPSSHGDELPNKIKVYSTDEVVIFRGTHEQIAFFGVRFYELHISKKIPFQTRREWDESLGIALQRGIVMVHVGPCDKSKMESFWRAIKETNEMKPIEPER